MGKENSFEEIKPEIQPIATEFEDNGFSYKAYNRGVQFNVEDINGIIQSFYPTTGTIMFHRSNSRTDHATYTIHDSNIMTFINYLNNPEKIQDFFLD